MSGFFQDTAIGAAAGSAASLAMSAAGAFIGGGASLAGATSLSLLEAGGSGGVLGLAFGGVVMVGGAAFSNGEEFRYYPGARLGMGGSGGLILYGLAKAFAAYAEPSEAKVPQAQVAVAPAGHQQVKIHRDQVGRIVSAEMR